MAASALFVTSPVTAADVPAITAMFPAEGSPGDTIQITGSNLGYGALTALFSGPNGTQIRSTPADPSPTLVVVQVPRLAQSGPVSLLVPDGSGAFIQTNALNFTRTPGLRIRASKKDVSAAETDDFMAVVFGATSPQVVQWTTDVGSVDSGGRYTAPSSLQSDQFALVTGCLQGTSICDSLMLGLHPFRIVPNAPVVPLGERLDLDATSGGSQVFPTWSNLSELGMLDGDGDYRAPRSPDHGGSVLLSAELQGIQEQTQVGVTGAFPGLVNRISDYIDFRKVSFQSYTSPSSVAVSGDRVYVLSPQLGKDFQPHISYIDVYDITDRAHPKWLTSAESATDGKLFFSRGKLYSVGSSGQFGENVAMAAYELQREAPALSSWQLTPTETGLTFADGITTVLEQSSNPADSLAIVDQFFPVEPDGARVQIKLPPPFNGADYTMAVLGVVRHYLYAVVYNNSIASVGQFPGYIVKYDISNTLATVLSSVPFSASARFSGALAGERLAVVGQQVFDLSGETPVLISTLPDVLTLLDGNDHQLVGTLAYQGDFRIFQARDNSALEEVGSIVSCFCAADARLWGEHLYVAEGSAGLAVYDVSKPGGPRFESAVGFGTAYSQLVADKYLYSAGDAFGGFLLIQDITQDPPSQVAFVATGPAPVNDLALVGTSLYVATTQNLLLYDVNTVSQPTLITTVGVAVNSLYARGHVLFVGTSDGHLIVTDVSNPLSPVELAVTGLPDKPVQMTVTNNLLLIADRTGGLLVFDISNPGSPVFRSQLKVARAVVGVQADGNLALLAALEAGLVVVDLSAPSQPGILSSVSFDTFDPFQVGLPVVRNQASSVVLKNKIAFVGTFILPIGFDGTGGMLYGVDYSEPQHARLVSTSAATDVTSSGILSLALGGDDLFISLLGEGPKRENVERPRNTISLFYPPASLRTFITPPPLAATRGGLKF